MQYFSWYSIAIFCIFNLFIDSQWQTSKDFRGANKDYGVFLSLSASIGKLVTIAYLLYYGWAVIWWAPFAIYLIASVASTVRFLVTGFLIDLIGFIAWPVCAYFMFIYVLNPPI
jgi:hypothetical protein